MVAYRLLATVPSLPVFPRTPPGPQEGCASLGSWPPDPGPFPPYGFTSASVLLVFTCRQTEHSEMKGASLGVYLLKE